MLLALVGVVSPVLHLPPVIALAITAVLLGFFVGLRHYETAIENRVYSWRIGRDAEWDVRDALVNHLSDSFYLLNDVVLPGHGGNIDHIVIGPSGIHTVETKGDVGNVDATGERLRIRGFPKDKYLRTCAARQQALRRFLETRLPGESRTYPIYPTIVFTRASEVRSRGTTGGVCVEDIDGLLRLLDKYADRRRLDELHRAEIFHALRPHVASAGKRVLETLSK